MVQQGTIGINTPDGTVNVPIYSPTDVDYPVVRAIAPNGNTAALPFVPIEESPAYNQVRVYHENYGVMGLHDTAQLSQVIEDWERGTFDHWATVQNDFRLAVNSTASRLGDYGLEMDGYSRVIDMPSNGNLPYYPSAADEWTVWIYPQWNGNDHAVQIGWLLEDGNGDNKFLISVEDQSVQFRDYNGGDFTHIDQITSSLPEGKWYKLSVTPDSSGFYMSIEDASGTNYGQVGVSIDPEKHGSRGGVEIYCGADTHAYVDHWGSRLSDEDNGTTTTGSTIEQWDDNSFINYSTTSNIEHTTSWIQSGSYSVQPAGGAGGGYGYAMSNPGDGLPSYIYRGDSFRSYFNVTAGTSDISNPVYYRFRYGGSSTTSYQIQVEVESGNFKLYNLNTSTTDAIANDYDAPINSGVHYIDVTFGNPTHTLLLVEESTGNTVSKLSVDDSEHDNGGIMWGVRSDTTAANIMADYLHFI